MGCGLLPGSEQSIEISYKIQAFGHAYLVHCTKLQFHSRGGYFNSPVLQALELLPGRAEQIKMSYISKRQLACNNVCHMFVILMVLMGNCLSLFTKFLHHYSYCHMLSSFHLGMLTVSEAAKIK